MSNQTVIEALREKDWSILDRREPVTSTIAMEIEAALPEFKATSSELAAIWLDQFGDEHAGKVLLAMTQNRHMAARTVAAEAIVRCEAPPPVAKILQTIPHQDDEIVRALLYLAVGEMGAREHVAPLRRIRESEVDQFAALDLLAAIVRLGADEERREFVTLLDSTETEDALDMAERLVYTREPRATRGLHSWLRSGEPVTRLSGDRVTHMARMCDIAVWTAHRMGIPLKPTPVCLANFDATLINHAIHQIGTIPE
jgi:hypothetical protein